MRLRGLQATARAAGRLFGLGLGVFSEISASGSPATGDAVSRRCPGQMPRGSS